MLAALTAGALPIAATLPATSGTSIAPAQPPPLLPGPPLTTDDAAQRLEVLAGGARSLQIQRLGVALAAQVLRRSRLDARFVERERTRACALAVGLERQAQRAAVRRVACACASWTDFGTIVRAKAIGAAQRVVWTSLRTGSVNCRSAPPGMQTSRHTSQSARPRRTACAPGFNPGGGISSVSRNVSPS